MAVRVLNSSSLFVVGDNSFNGWDGMTIILWYRVASVAAGPRTILSKLQLSSTSDQWTLFRPSAGVGPNDWWFVHRRTTTSTSMRTTGNIIQAGRWEWLCILDSDGVAPELLHGTLGVFPGQPTYDERITGSGGAAAETDNDLVLLNSAAFTDQASVSDDLGFVALYDRRMSLREALSHWSRPRLASGCRFLAWPGMHHDLGAVVTNIVDMSGNKKDAVYAGPASNATAREFPGLAFPLTRPPEVSYFAVTGTPPDPPPPTGGGSGFGRRKRRRRRTFHV